MAISKTAKSKVITGLCGGKVAFLGASGAWEGPESFDYLTSLSLKNQVSTTDQYADDKRIYRKLSDAGIEGEIGTTSQDIGFEQKSGYLIEADGGLLAEIKARGAKPCCFYFEHTRVDAATETEYKVKTWLINCHINKATEETHDTDTDKPSFAAYKYPIVVDGENMKAASGDTDAVDENGFEICVYKVISCPGDTGYATFGDAVPAIKQKGK